MVDKGNVLDIRVLVGECPHPPSPPVFDELKVLIPPDNIMADLPWRNVKMLYKTALLIRNLIFDQKFNKISTEDRKKFILKWTTNRRPVRTYSKTIHQTSPHQDTTVTVSRMSWWIESQIN